MEDIISHENDPSSMQVQKLHEALRYWVNLQLDYEGLQDEIIKIDSSAGKDACVLAARDFAPQELNDAEILQIIEPKQDQTRTPSQIVEVLRQRSEYVSRNVASLRRQLSRLEAELGTQNAVSDDEDVGSSEAQDLPHLDIVEQLDDDDNVIDAKVLPQSEAAIATLKVLDQAYTPQTDPEEITKSTLLSEGGGRLCVTSRISDLSDESEDDDDTLQRSSIIQPTNPSDTEEEAQLRQEMLQYGLAEVENIVAELEIAEDDNEDMNDPATNQNDLAWDDEDDEDDSGFSSEEASDDEDEIGQAKGTIHTEQYRQKMEKLQEKLGMRLENIGPNSDMAAGIREQVEHPSTADVQKYIHSLPPGLREKLSKSRPDPREAARRAAIAREEAARLSSSEAPDDARTDTNKPNKAKKKVAFAEDLDIAPNTRPQRAAIGTSSIIERSANTTRSEQQTAATSRKKSKFKMAQEKAHDPLLPPPMDENETINKAKPTPTGPPNKIIANTLVEHTQTSQNSQAPVPMDPDDFDVEIQQKQIAIEHYQIRNKMIHDQGGYVNGGESENWGSEYAVPEVTDSETGQVKKISRFKAARMRP